MRSIVFCRMVKGCNIGGNVSLSADIEFYRNGTIFLEIAISMTFLEP
jgi:hypothetical protein